MDLIYKIEDWFIYDNVFNRKCRFVASVYPKNGVQSDLDFIIRYNESIVVEDMNTNDLVYELIGKSHLSNYNAYSMKWNETKFGIDLTKYNTFYIQLQDGKNFTYFSFDICKTSRAEAMRDYQLNQLV